MCVNTAREGNGVRNSCATSKDQFCTTEWFFHFDNSTMGEWNYGPAWLQGPKGGEKGGAVLYENEKGCEYIG